MAESCEITHKWMSLHLTDDQSILVPVMAWCCQATSHYLSQCWLSSMSLDGITRPQWVKYNWNKFVKRYFKSLTHWGRVTHICVSKVTIIGSDNGLPPGRRQAIIWTNAEILLIGHLGTNFSEILIVIYIFSFKKMQLIMWSGKWQPFCLGLKVLMTRATRLKTCPCSLHSACWWPSTVRT